MLDQMKMELDFKQVKKFEAGFTNESAFFLEKHGLSVRSEPIIREKVVFLRS